MELFLQSGWADRRSAVNRSGVARSASIGVSAEPHCLQNFASAELIVLQFEQMRCKGWPQFWQKRASDGLSCEQLLHFMTGEGNVAKEMLGETRRGE